MKKTFKFMPLLLASLLVLVLFLTACGGTDISGNVTDVNSPSPTPDAAPPTPEEREYEMGSANGGVYTNDFLKIGCKLDENWSFYNDDQLAQLSGITADAIQDEDISKLFRESADSGKVIFDMYAASADGLATINILFENLGVVYGFALDEDKYIDLAMENLQQSLEASGIEKIALEKTAVDFAGASRAAIAITGELSGVPLYESLICMKQGNYMASITICSVGENITEQLAGLFYAID